MKRKLPLWAFDHYLSLGPGRSYDAVAKEFNVTKAAVVRLAQRESWQERIQRIEAKTRELGDQRAVESITSIRERHAKLGKLLQGRGAEAIVRLQIQKPADALRAIEVGIEQELEAVAPGHKSRAQGAIDAQDHARTTAERIREFLAMAEASVPPVPPPEAPPPSAS